MRVTESWRLKAQRYTLEGQMTEEGQVNFPPRPVTPRPVQTFDFHQPEPIGISKDTLRQTMTIRLEVE